MWLSLGDKRFGSFIEDTLDTFAAAQNLCQVLYIVVD